MTPSPFEVSRAIGNNLSAGFREQKEKSAIDEILTSTLDSEDPEAYQKTIGMILSKVRPENQKNIFDILNNRTKQLAEQKEKKLKLQAAQEGGYNAYAPPGVQTQQAKDKSKTDYLNGVFGQPQPEMQMAGEEQAPPNMQPPSVAKQPQISSNNPFANMPNDKLRILTGSPYKEVSEPAKAQLNANEEKEKQNEKVKLAIEERYAKRNEGIIKKLDDDATALPAQEQALAIMKQAIANKDQSFWSKDNLAEWTGIEWFRSPESALFKSQAKQYFLGDLESIKGRANQLIENQILGAQARIGLSTAANLSILRADQMKLDLKKERIRIGNEIINQERGQNKEPRDLAKQINDQLVPYAIEKEKEMHNDFVSYNIIEDKKNDQQFIKVKKGTVATDYVIKALLKRYNNNIDKANDQLEKLGYAREED